MSLRTIIAASLSSTLCIIAGVSAASAQGYSWTGFSVYGGVGGHQLDGDVDVNDTTNYGVGTECRGTNDDWDFPLGFIPCFELGPFSKANTNSIASALNGDPGVFGTVGVAGDVEATPGVVIGAFADIDWSNADADFSGSSTSTIKSFDKRGKEIFNLSSTTSVSGSMDYDYSYTLGGRIGILTLNRQALLYVLGGYTRLETDGGTALVQNSVDFRAFRGKINTGYSANPISVKLPDSYDGYTFGIGGQAKLSQAWSIKLEGRYTNLQSKSVKYSGDTDK